MIIFIREEKWWDLWFVWWFLLLLLLIKLMSFVCSRWIWFYREIDEMFFFLDLKTSTHCPICKGMQNHYKRGDWYIIVWYICTIFMLICSWFGGSLAFRSFGRIPLLNYSILLKYISKLEPICVCVVFFCVCRNMVSMIKNETCIARHDIQKRQIKTAIPLKQ